MGQLSVHCLAIYLTSFQNRHRLRFNTSINKPFWESEGGISDFHVRKIIVNHLPTLTEIKSLENRLQSSSKFANYDLEESVFCLETFPLEKTESKFSSIAFDQANEQNNAIVKGDGGAIWLTVKGSRRKVTGNTRPPKS